MGKFDFGQVLSNLDKKYSKIKQIYFSEKEEIEKNISEISTQIEQLNKQRSQLKNQDFQNGIDYMVLKNNAAKSCAEEGLNNFSGNIVDISIYKKEGKSLADLFYLDLKKTDDSLNFKRRESKGVELDKNLMFNSLNQIADIIDSYEKIVDFSNIYNSELDKRKKEIKVFSESLLLDFLDADIKADGKRKIDESYVSVDKLKNDLIDIKDKLKEEFGIITSNLPRIIRESCNAPISDFKNKNDLYIKENKDKYIMVIDNHNKIISNGLLKRININPRSHPELIYLEVDKKNFDSLNNWLKNSYQRKNYKFDLETSVKLAIEENYKSLGLISLVGSGTGTLGTIISQWAHSWASQTPVQHGEYSFIAGGILAGISILGYSAFKGAIAIKNKIEYIKNNNRRNDVLVDTIKKTKRSSNPLEIVKNLALTYK